MTSRYFNKPNGPIYPGAEPRDNTGGNQLSIRTAETTQRFIYGTRYLTWDGRVFKYGYAVAAVYSYHGANASEAAVMSWTSNPVAGSAGDRHIIATMASRTVDDCAGGYIMMYDGSATDTTMLFGVVGNEPTSGTTTKLYIDGALPVASVATTDKHEFFENPYRELTEATASYVAWMGVPAYTAAATYNFWLQTWGPAYISPGETIDSPAADSRTIVWGSNAALFKLATKTSGQIAGYIINQGSSSIAGPLIMLMCST